MGMTTDSATALLSRSKRNAPPASTVQVTSWRLQYVGDGHYKFYTCLAASDGRLIIGWGRIGTVGQWKFENPGSFDSAETIAKKQFYAKSAKGYTVIEDAFTFTATTEAVNTAFDNRVVDMIEHERDLALQSGLANQEAATQHYDRFINRAEELMGRAGAGVEALEPIIAAWTDLKTSWGTLKDKHEAAATTLKITEAVVGTRLLRP